MRPSRPTTSEWVIAVSGGAWVAVFLGPTTAWAFAIAPLTVAAMLWLRQTPVSCSLLLAALHLGASAVGVPAENPAGLVPAIVAFYALGRHAAAIRGAATAAVYLLATIVWNFTLPTLLFAGFLLGAPSLSGGWCGAVPRAPIVPTPQPSHWRIWMPRG